MRPALMLGSVVFIAALFMVASTFPASEPFREWIIAVAVGVLFLVAAALLSGTLRVEVSAPEEEEKNRGKRRGLRKLANDYGLDGKGDAEEMRARILAHLWHEKTSGRRATPIEPQSAELLVDHLATPRPELEPENLKSFNRGTLRLLVAEGKSLLALARLFNIEKESYTRMVTRARRQMRNGDMERSIQAMQVANDKLRAKLEEQVTREW